MKPSRDSSLLKSLAIAFGDGLAFGVGMKIVQSSAKPRSLEAAAAGPAEAPALASGEALDAQAFQKVRAPLEAILAEHLGKVERRLAETEAQMALELRACDGRQSLQASKAQASLEQAQAALQSRIDSGDAANGDRLAEFDRKLDSVTQRMASEVRAALEPGVAQGQAATEERLQAYVDARVQALEERLHTDITEAGNRTADLLVQTIETRLLQRIAQLEAAAGRQDEAIRALRGRSARSEQKLHSVLLGFSRACEDAIRELAAQPEAAEPEATEAAAPVPEPEPDASGGTTSEPAAEPDHRYDSLTLVNYQPRPERKIPIPLVSSIALLLLLGLAAMNAQGLAEWAKLF